MSTEESVKLQVLLLCSPEGECNTIKLKVKLRKKLFFPTQVSWSLVSGKVICAAPCVLNMGR